MCVCTVSQRGTAREAVVHRSKECPETSTDGGWEGGVCGRRAGEEPREGKIQISSSYANMGCSGWGRRRGRLQWGRIAACEHARLGQPLSRQISPPDRLPLVLLSGASMASASRTQHHAGALAAGCLGPRHKPNKERRAQEASKRRAIQHAGTLIWSRRRRRGCLPKALSGSLGQCVRDPHSFQAISGF